MDAIFKGLAAARLVFTGFGAGAGSAAARARECSLKAAASSLRRAIFCCRLESVAGATGRGMGSGIGDDTPSTVTGAEVQFLRQCSELKTTWLLAKRTQGSWRL